MSQSLNGIIGVGGTTHPKFFLTQLSGTHIYDMINMFIHMGTVADLPNCISMFKPSQIQGEFQCIYCGKKFQKQNALRIHLGNCKKRALRRDFQFEGRTIYVYMNPRRDVYHPLKEMTLKSQDEPTHFLGALEYLKCAGWVTGYTAFKDEV